MAALSVRSILVQSLSAVSNMIPDVGNGTYEPLYNQPHTAPTTYGAMNAA